MALSTGWIGCGHMCVGPRAEQWQLCALSLRGTDAVAQFQARYNRCTGSARQGTHRIRPLSACDTKEMLQGSVRRYGRAMASKSGFLRDFINEASLPIATPRQLHCRGCSDLGPNADASRGKPLLKLATG